MSRILSLVLVAAALWSGVAEFGSAWQEPESNTSARATASIVRRYEPGVWSAMDVYGSNRGEEDSEELVSVYFDSQPHLQFARRFWLPAGSQRRTWLPVRTPTDLPANQKQMTASVLRLGKAGEGGEVFQRSKSGRLQVVQQPLVVDHSSTKTAILFRRGLPDAYGSRPELDWDAYETIYKTREAILQSRVMIDLDTNFLPPWPQSFDSIDQIAICGDRLSSDSVGLRNVQQWLQRGGRIWVLLDRTDIGTVRALLGNSAGCQIVDRVELSSFEIEDTSRPEGPFVAATWENDEPVEMVRVLADDLEVVCTVDGWPAAFWQQVGDGEVLFTTLGPRGWLTPGNAPSEPLKMIGSRFFSSKRERELPVEALQPLLNEQIGYRIPQRWLAGSILGFNTVGLLVVGGWLARRRRLDGLAIAIPILALVTAAAFIVIGNRNTNAVPPTVTWRQIARVEPATDVMHVAGLAAIYDQQPADLELDLSRGAAVLPDDLGRGGVTKRGIWDDDGACHWENVKLAPGGVNYVKFRRAVPLETPLRARGVFGPEGFSGRLEGGSFEDIGDATVAARAAPLAAANWSSDGTFSTGIDDVLAPDQYIAGALMSDEQRRREAVLRQVLASNVEQEPFVDEPALLIWSRPRDVDVVWPDKYELSGAALTAIPIEMDRTPSGQSFVVPSSLIKTENYSGQRGASSVFNPRTGKWLEGLNKPSISELRFILPESVTPAQVTKALLTIKVHAPSRRLTINAMVDGRSETLHEIPNPSGVLRFTIDRPEALQLDERGGIFLGFSISETERQREALEKKRKAKTANAERRPVRGDARANTKKDTDSFENSTWQIDYVRLNVWGQTS